MSDTVENNIKITLGRVLAKNVLWNLLGRIIPLTVAFFAIPILIKGLGTERFGVLSIAWMTIGYFTLFDLGLGRTLTKFVAEELGKEDQSSLPSLIWTGIGITFLMGAIGTIMLALSSNFLVHNVLKVPADLQPETVKSFYVLAASLPIVISTSGLYGVLEGHQMFGIVNAIRAPMGIFNFLAPLAVLPFSSSLFPMVVVLAFGRLIAWCVYFRFCLYAVPGLLQKPKFYSEVKSMLSFGGWLTVSNIINPLLVYFDRFLIGALVSMTAVTYYTTPYEIVTRLWMIPLALVSVLFPAFATTFSQDKNRITVLFERGFAFLFLTLFPVCLFLKIFAFEGLKLWLGQEFAIKSSFALQCFVIGVFINSFARLPFTLIQSAGRADITAKLHILELILSFPVLWWLLTAYGINGAAIAWVCRIAADTLALYGVSYRLFSQMRTHMVRNLLYLIVAAISFMITGLFSHIMGKTLLFIFLLITFSLFTWFRLVTPEDRNRLQRYLTLNHYMRSI